MFMMYRRAYPDSDEEEAVRTGYEPAAETREPRQLHTLDSEFAVGDDDDDVEDRDGVPHDGDEAEEDSQWEHRNYSQDPDPPAAEYHDESANVWRSSKS